jgi:hypothetical protein
MAIVAPSVIRGAASTNFLQILRIVKGQSLIVVYATEARGEPGVARSPTLSQTDVLSRRHPVRSAEQQAGKSKDRAECERREDRFFLKNPVRRDY